MVKRIEDGRAAQKARTRTALLEAARRLMDEGAIVSVTSAAEAAGISKATAYRYFADPRTLTVEAILDARMKPIEVILDGATEPRERVHRVRRFLFELTRESEAQFRQFMARSMEFWLAHGGEAVEMVRGGRRLPMYREALAPAAAALGPAKLEQLVSMLAATSGLESYLALKDVCRLDDAEAHVVAEAITDAVLDRFLPASA